jgi:hypothetical protein
MRRLRLAVPAALGALAIFAATAAAGDNDSGFKTTQAAMLDCPSCSEVTPLITVGEKLPGGYLFEALPDGISVDARGNGRVDLYVNHETSTVAFPYVAASPTAANSQNDFVNSEVSLLGLNQRSAGVLFGRTLIPSSTNYQRFCSNYLATAKEGFDRDLFFTNEEAQDWVFRSGTAWSQFITPGTAGAEQPGVVVATDRQTGQHRTIYGMGRFNHENDVAIAGYGKPVVVSGDDTFSTTPASSQLYMYVADDSSAVWNDEGTLYAFSLDDATKTNYFNVQPGDAPLTGHFIPVPKTIATGKGADGADLTRADDFPSFPAPPAGTPDGPQWVLDQWGNAANNTLGRDVFDFIRIEDTAYDKRSGMSNVVYLADSGRGTAGAANPASVSTNGRIWKLELDLSNPLEGTLSVLIQGDDNPVKTFDEIHQPDNLETTAAGSLFVQEDPGSSQQFAPADFGLPNATTARIWRYDLAAGTMAPVAKVDQSADEGPTDVDPSGLSAWGAWESSGIVDASAVFGPGSFFVDVQAHSLWIEKADGPDVIAPVGPDWTFKREGGQLLLIKRPGW